MYEFCQQFAKSVAKLSDEQVTIRRKQIHSLMTERLEEAGRTLTPDNIPQMFTERMLDYMLSLYDEHFFENSLMATFRANKCCLIVCMENRCTRTGGKCWYKGKTFTIKISSKVFKKSFENMQRDKRSVGHQLCSDILECLMMIFEHELVHAVLGCNCIELEYKDTTDKEFGTYSGKTNPKTGHSKTFMSILYNRFVHTDFKHNIYGTQKGSNNQKLYTQSDLKKGDKVYVRFDLTSKSKNESIKRPCLFEIKRLNKKTLSGYMIDKEALEFLNRSDPYSKLIKINYYSITSIVDVIEYPSGSPMKKPTYKLPTKKRYNGNLSNDNKPLLNHLNEIKTQKAHKPSEQHRYNIKRKHTLIQTNNCNNRNPNPPCKPGFTKRKRPNGSMCCYKDYSYKPTKKTFKIKRKGNNTKSVVK